jgi:hypothetical protein
MQLYAHPEKEGYVVLVMADNQQLMKLLQNSNMMSDMNYDATYGGLIMSQETYKRMKAWFINAGSLLDVSTIRANKDVKGLVVEGKSVDAVAAPRRRSVHTQTDGTQPQRSEQTTQTDEPSERAKRLRDSEGPEVLPQPLPTAVFHSAPAPRSPTGSPKTKYSHHSNGNDVAASSPRNYGPNYAALESVILTQPMHPVPGMDPTFDGMQQWERPNHTDNGEAESLLSGYSNFRDIHRRRLLMQCVVGE